MLTKPAKIKCQEKSRINPSIFSLNPASRIPLIQGVTYLWVINRFIDVVVGVEKPWLHPELFGLKADCNVWLNIKRQLLYNAGNFFKKDGFGHPTLAISWLDTDRNDNKEKQRISYEAYYGGEINFINNHWVVNNYSGRYGKNKRSMEENINNLIMVANQLKSFLASTTVIVNFFYTSHYMKMYYKHWNKQQEVIKSIEMLLRDYAYGLSIGSRLKLLFNMRNLNNINAVKAIVSEPLQLEIMLAAIRNITNPDSGLSKRIDFINAEILRINFNKKATISLQ